MYPPGEWPPGAPTAPAPQGFDLRSALGARRLARPLPRFGISLAAAGAGLALVGAFVWSVGYYAEGLDFGFDESSGSATASGEARRFLGFVLFLGFTVLGCAVAAVRRTGPLATAGTVLGAFGVPLTITFLTLDVGDAFRGSYPFNLDAVVLVSILAWLVGYLVIPGLRGHALLLALAATGLHSYIGLKVGGSDAVRAGAGVFGVAPGHPDIGSLTAVGLVFGLAYYAIAAALDARGQSGAAVAFVVAGFDATTGGIAVGASDIGVAGTGVILLVIGAVLAAYGARSGRRFTTWIWSAGFALGVLLIVGKIFSESYTGAGIVLIAIGLVIALAAAFVSHAVGEAPDVVEPVAEPRQPPASWA